MSPKSMTAEIRPSCTRTFAGWRSPCSHTRGPVHAGTVSTSDHSPRTASASSSAASCATRVCIASSRAASGTPRNWFAGAVRWRGEVKRTQERAERFGRRVSVMRRAHRGRRARKPLAHAPRPGITGTRATDMDRRGDRQREQRCELGQPTLLALDERRGRQAARESHREVGAEPVHHVVPTDDRIGQRERRELGMLLGEEAPDQRLVDDDVGRRHRIGSQGALVSTARRARARPPPRAPPRARRRSSPSDDRAPPRADATTGRASTR